MLQPRSLFLLLCLTPISAIAGDIAPLPRAFSGWVRSTEPVAATPEPQIAPAFREFRMMDETQANYAQNGNTLHLSLYRFPDYTGAYGAFTLLRQPEMLPQKIGDEAAAGTNRVLFFRGNVLVDAVFDRVTAMTLSQLRDLAKELPVAANPGNPPTLPRYLPPDNLSKSSVRYAIGPAGAKIAGLPVDPAHIDYNASPEVVTAIYGTPSAPENLSLVSFPTPQIAGDTLRRLQPEVGDARIRRTHSIVVMVSGDAAPQDAKALLNFVNYDADLTWNEPTKLSPRDNVLGLLANVILLSGFLGAVMLIMGLSFGGFRALYYRFHPEKAEAREEQQQLIRLNLG